VQAEQYMNTSPPINLIKSNQDQIFKKGCILQSQAVDSDGLVAVGESEALGWIIVGGEEAAAIVAGEGGVVVGGALVGPSARELVGSGVGPAADRVGEAMVEIQTKPIVISTTRRSSWEEEDEEEKREEDGGRMRGGHGNWFREEELGIVAFGSLREETGKGEEREKSTDDEGGRKERKKTRRRGFLRVLRSSSPSLQN